MTKAMVEEEFLSAISKLGEIQEKAREVSADSPAVATVDAMAYLAGEVIDILRVVAKETGLTLSRP